MGSECVSVTRNDSIRSYNSLCLIIQMSISSPRVPDCFICPISSVVMTDPYCTIDGFSYERTAIEAWLNKSCLSPLTGQPLANTVIIPNRNLKKAIDFYRKDESTVAEVTRKISVHLSDRGFSTVLKGSAVEIKGDRILSRVAQASVWTDAAAFIDAPLKGYGLSSRVTLEITRDSSEWGGLVVGVSPIDFRAAPDRMRLLEETSFRLDGQGWFFQPNQGASLAGWNSADLTLHQQVTMELPADGSFAIRVNGEKKIDIRDVKIPDGPLFAFVAPLGSCAEVTLIAP